MTTNQYHDPMPGIPADVACPWCGGYVRGHQWIGMSDQGCSVNHVEWDGYTIPRVLNPEAVGDPTQTPRVQL